MWRRVFQAFQHEYPFVNLELDFGRARPDFSSDVAIVPLATLEQPAHAVPAVARDLGAGGTEPEAFVGRLLDQGRVAPAPELACSSLLRATTILAVNQPLFAKYGLTAGPIATPGDWFRLGHALTEQQGGQIYGFNYCGFHFHSTYYGVELREQDGQWRLTGNAWRGFWRRSNPVSNAARWLPPQMAHEPFL